MLLPLPEELIPYIDMGKPGLVLKENATDEHKKILEEYKEKIRKAQEQQISIIE